MRFMFVTPLNIPLEYQNILHSHSHFAILGWLYNALYIALVYTYVKEPGKQGKYNNLFWVTQVSIAGMLVTFAIEGYAAFSIAFSTLHIFCEYAFIIFLLRDLRIYKNETYSLKFIYGALFFLFLSSLGPWGLVMVVLNTMQGSDLYKQVIYFYLHFQYNGWFVFAIIGLWLKFLEDRGAKYKSGSAEISFQLLFFSTIGAYFLSLLGFAIPEYLKFVGIASAFLQMNGIRYLYKLLFANEALVTDVTGDSVQQRSVRLLFRFSFLALFIKFIMQLISALPKIGDAAFVNREVTIGYIHLVMLGVISTGIIGWFAASGLMNAGKIFSFGIRLFIAALLVNEILLFYPALVMWFSLPGFLQYTAALFITAALMLAGIVVVFVSTLSKKEKI